MKRFLVVLFSACLILTAGMVVFSAHADGFGYDVIYVQTDGSDIESVYAYFGINGGPGIETVVGNAVNENGLYQIEVPEGAESVYFDIDHKYYPYECDGSSKFILSELSGNIYNTADNTWSTEQRLASSQESITINVSGKVAKSTRMVSVDVKWGSMEFTYDKGTWDPATHVYTNPTWTPSGNTITVTNHSNANIAANFAFAKANGINVTGEFRNQQNGVVTSVNLASADQASGGAPSQDVVTFHITGGSIDQNTSSLGTITVTINPQD